MIRRLVIDPITKQIVFADLELIDTGRLVRVPWDHFECTSHDIVLNRSEADVQKIFLRATGAGLPEAVTLEVMRQAETYS